MSKRRKDPPLVILEWEDSAQPVSNWQFRRGWKCGPVIRIASVGWLIHDGKKVKVLAPNVGGLDGKVPPQMCGVIHIPARCVISITKLTEAPA